MKRSHNIVSAIILIFFLIASCKKTSGGKEKGDNFSDSIRAIIPQPIIDSLRKWGMTINSGTNPATVNGIYLFSPTICTFDNSGFNSVGRRFDDYKFKFSRQSNVTSSIRVDYKDVNSATDFASDSVATFISGSGSLFTIFAQEKGVSNGISYTSLSIYSGEVTSAGIKHFQKSTYLKDKSADVIPVLIAIGKSRIFVDGDSTSSTVTTFSVQPPLQQGGVIGNSFGTRVLGIKNEN